MRPLLLFAVVALACSDGAKTRKLGGTPQSRDASTPFGGGGEGDALPLPIADAETRPADAADGDGEANARDAGERDAHAPEVEDATPPAQDAAPPAQDAAAGPDPDARGPMERDAQGPDARPPRDPDAAPPQDPDAAPPLDPDAAPPPPPGVTPTPCLRGPGSTLFRMHWSGGSHSADIDVWEAPCDYGLDVNGCSALPICRGGIGCEVGVTDGGEALALEGGNEYLQVRFRVTGLQFQTVTVYMEARGMQGNTDFEAWSPLYGPTVYGPVGWGFEYEAGAFDWSHALFPFDDPDLTAIRITPVNGALAIHAFEMCLE